MSKKPISTIARRFPSPPLSKEDAPRVSEFKFGTPPEPPEEPLRKPMDKDVPDAPIEEKQEPLVSVAEIFQAIQGEGSTSGRASFFVRLAGCNRRCSWCDTEHAQKLSSGRYMTAKDIYAAFEANKNIRNVVITGGEPLLQQEAREFVKLLNILRIAPGRRYTIEMETNGDILPNVTVRQHVYRFNVSPKLENSGGAPIKKENLRYWMKEPKAILKFVVRDKRELDEIVQLYRNADITQLDTAWQKRLFIMPEGATRELQMVKARFLTDVCLKKGLNMSIRSHILVWDEEKQR